MQPTLTQLPYVGPRKSKPFRAYRVYVEMQGVMTKVGHGYATLGRALSLARKISQGHAGSVTVNDDRLSVNQRTLAIFRNGIEKFNRIDIF